MTQQIEPIQADILSTKRDRTGQFVIMRVQLNYRLCGEAAAATQCVTVTQKGLGKWHLTKRHGIEAAWLKIEDYFAGAPLDGEEVNFFSDTSAPARSSSLSVEDERNLRAELTQIENETIAA